mmetsp:Transcript_43110/g.69990  ORF Transcript_43110/g.69990 Transcript_43110/m.69990 type:complete len:616 (-) Transcript_43110:560-2407(-)
MSSSPLPVAFAQTSLGGGVGTSWALYQNVVGAFAPEVSTSPRQNQRPIKHANFAGGAYASEATPIRASVKFSASRVRKTSFIGRQQRTDTLERDIQPCEWTSFECLASGKQDGNEDDSTKDSKGRAMTKKNKDKGMRAHNIPQNMWSKMRVFRDGELDTHDMKRVLGSGGFSQVFKATIVKGEGNGNEVVVKALDNKERTLQQGQIELYINHMLSQVHFDNMPGFIGYHKTNDRFWIVWRLEGEQNLEEALTEESWLESLEKTIIIPKYGAVSGTTPTERKNLLIREIMTQVLNGIIFVHSHNIVHRDIKPANVVIGHDGILRLIDFGCAADLSSGIGHVPKEAPGTREYLPPEWKLDTAHSSAFDAFGAGMILLQLAFPVLRSSVALDAFRIELKDASGDVEEWLLRKRQTVKKGAAILEEGTNTLQHGDGACWDVLVGLLNRQPADRMSIEVALERVSASLSPSDSSLSSVGEIESVEDFKFSASDIYNVAPRAVAIEVLNSTEVVDPIMPLEVPNGNKLEIPSEVTELFPQRLYDVEHIAPSSVTDGMIPVAAPKQDPFANPPVATPEQPSALEAVTSILGNTTLTMSPSSHPGNNAPTPSPPPFRGFVVQA